ncbi:MAG: DNA-binding protein [Oceanospirillaceae bacterium]|uniref:helix-turn-helix domain-containing protein n=1 Tax=unclassified Thalassolituus TaxID=2624967 RepID=UPI000C09B6FF|nr:MULTISPECIES: helix-turn-helix domain-containing protein [unclassified Thalassolituus]MAK90345.1 DNA-binding protein [Thalassolituus sp.]MAX99771.1 DNA-binding protein [Oceanospirillaceae bacterium]MBL34581.1 DNA-binding protein [Oceanospirillaceae bacterium]MBS54955.1 DNA-binding protein [Oceanospirillaceae bacterium]
MSATETLTLDQVAEFLAMKPVTIKRYVREGLLDGKEENGHLVFEPEKVNRFKELQARLR